MQIYEESTHNSTERPLGLSVSIRTIFRNF